MMEERDNFSMLSSTEDNEYKRRDNFSMLSLAEDNEYKRFGIKVDKINGGLSFGMCISYDKYAKECYLFINLIKWEVSIGWLTFESKEE